MLGTFAVSWFGFAFLCWLALRQVTISDSEVALALMEIVYWSAVTVFSAAALLRSHSVGCKTFVCGASAASFCQFVYYWRLQYKGRTCPGSTRKLRSASLPSSTLGLSLYTGVNPKCAFQELGTDRSDRQDMRRRVARLRGARKYVQVQQDHQIFIFQTKQLLSP